MQRFVARRVADPYLAADLTADVFLAAIDSAPSYRPERGEPAAWLFGIARNVVGTEHRRSGRELAQRRQRAAGCSTPTTSPHARAARRRARPASSTRAGRAAGRRARGARARRARRPHPRRGGSALGDPPRHGTRTAAPCPRRSAAGSPDPIPDRPTGGVHDHAQRFEDRLLDELRTIVAERPPGRIGGRRRRAGSARPLIGIGVVATGAAAIAIVAASGSRTPAAYAVQPRADGAVTVTIRSLQDAAGPAAATARRRRAGLRRLRGWRNRLREGREAARGRRVRLGAEHPPVGHEERRHGAAAAGRRRRGWHGVPHRARPGQRPGPSGPAPDAGAPATTKVSVTPNGATFMIDPGTLKAGQHVYITTSTGAVTSIAMSVAKTKPAIPCPPAP